MLSQLRGSAPGYGLQDSMLRELLRRRDDESDNDHEFEGDGMDSPNGDN